MTYGVFRLGEHYVKPRSRVMSLWSKVRPWLDQQNKVCQSHACTKPSSQRPGAGPPLDFGTGTAGERPRDQKAGHRAKSRLEPSTT